MRLKKLVIHGFKSFADRTVLEFDEGITAIVGPNGCGKSNVCDAFRWVLGEQSAKSMRGQKMGDIIFAGTSTRKPLNFAEVTLVFSDVGDALPIEFDEVAVTRRLTRTGESQYLINRNPVRLKDVQNLFLDSGIGKHSFAFFEQGKIDQIINLGPNERRSIFEKAAGILRFLQRKEEAMRKLTQVDGNVNRVQDIHAEVERHLAQLEKQAEQARLFKQNREELHALEIAVALAKFTVLHEELENLDESDTGFNDQLDAAREVQVTLGCQLRDLKEALAHSEATLREQSEDVYKQRSAKALKSKERESSNERLKEAKERRKLLARDLKEIEKQRAESRKQVERDRKERERVLAKLQKAEQDYVAAQEVLQESESQIEEQRSAQQSAQQMRMDLVKEESRLHSEQQQKQLRLETCQDKLTQLEETQSALESRLAGLGEQVDEKQAEWKECADFVDNTKKHIAKLDTEVTNLKSQISKKEAELEHLLKERAQVTARENALSNLQKEREGVSKGAKQLLDASTTKDGPLAGKISALYELLDAEEGNEKLLASALQPYQDTLVVQTEADLVAVIDFAQEKKIKDFSLLCQANLVGKSSKKEKWEALLNKTLPGALSEQLLDSIYCAEDVSKAWAYKKESAQGEFVTGDGARIDHRGVVFFAGQGDSNVFVREAELKNLRQRMVKLEKSYTDLEQDLEKLRNKQDEVEEVFRETDRALRQGEMKLVEANFALQQLKNQAQESQAQRKALAEEQAGLKQSVRELATGLREIEKVYQQIQRDAQKNLSQVERLDSQLERWESSLKEKREAFNEKQANYQEWKRQDQELNHKLELFDLQERETSRQQERFQQELDSLEDLEERMSSEGGDCDRDILVLSEELKQAEERCVRGEQLVKKHKQRIIHVEKNIECLAKQVKEWEGQHHKVGVKAAQIQSNIENLIKDLRERHELEVSQLKVEDHPLEKPLDESERRVRKLRKAIDDAGDINMAAIDECEKHRERAEFLGQQLGDLSESKEELLSIIARMDEESRKIFTEVFAKIRENFRKNFEILFRGGEADLTFIDGDDVLKSGIDIVARPPGKQMRSIQLLSGGEKCLTAMALLFAIFEVKSAPFCLLDEIDAPLDDSNIERFVNIVKQFVDRSQFVIITHNKRTMAIADRIFGVTMEQPGASKILSISFQHEMEDIEENVLVEQIT